MESKIKHLEFIQSVLNRFNGNCFLIKGWCVTLVAALFALAAKDANERYLLITYIATIVFWVLDAYFLSQERQYRRLYEEVTQRQPAQIDFNMNATRYCKGKCTWQASLFARTLLIFYGSVAALPLLLLLIFKRFL